ncbi:MAG: YfhO family protein [Ferruginibacter sp.]
MLKKIISNPFFLFPLLTFIFFWPASLQIFTFKNDALTYYYPVRTLISDAINNGELPLWTPFINMGYPLHADMQSGAWNPVIWAIGFITHYSLAAFHYEIIFYLALGGIGFYYLSREYGLNKYTALIIGVAYEFSGPVIDSVEFTACISSICYLPFIFLFFKRLLYHRSSVINALLTALFLYLLFTGGYPALFIITLYLLITFLLFAFFSSSQKKIFIKKIIAPLGILSILFVLLSLPAIISFVNHLQFIERGKTQGLDFVLENSMPPACMFSMISPFSTTATNSFFDTNILMRNVYIGIIPLIFLTYSMCNKVLRNNKEWRFFIIMAFVLFGMAWGTHFFLRQLAYYTLPLMNTFRHPALFRFFGVMFLLLAAGVGINKWSEAYDGNSLPRKITLAIGTIVLLIPAIIILSPGAKLLPGIFNISQLKSLIPSLNFQQRFLLQLPFIIATLCLFYFAISKKRNLFYLLLLSVADLFFATQLNLPVTVFGARSFIATERLINRNLIKFPLPGNTTIEQNILHSFDTTNTIGTTLTFEKRIGRNDYFITPGNLSSQEKFYESPARETVFKNQLLYFADTILTTATADNIELLTSPSFAITDATVSPSWSANLDTGTIAINKLSANSIECTADTKHPRLLILLQNIYPGWKAFIDGKETAIMKVNISFMGVAIPLGKHEIIFRYHPALIIYAWYVSLLTLLGSMLFLLFTTFRNILLPGHRD